MMEDFDEYYEKLWVKLGDRCGYCLRCKEKLIRLDYRMFPWAKCNGLESQYRYCFLCRLVYAFFPKLSEDDIDRFRIGRVVNPYECRVCGLVNDIDNIKFGKRVKCANCGYSYYYDEFDWCVDLDMKMFELIKEDIFNWDEEWIGKKNKYKSLLRPNYSRMGGLVYVQEGEYALKNLKRGNL